MGEGKGVGGLIYLPSKRDIPLSVVWRKRDRFADVNCASRSECS